MNLAWQNFWKHPKTSVTGFLSFIVTVSLALTADPALTPAYLPHNVVLAFLSFASTCKLILMFLSRDTGRQEVAEISGETKMENAHEEPDDPNAKPVLH